MADNEILEEEIMEEDDQPTIPKLDLTLYDTNQLENLKQSLEKELKSRDHEFYELDYSRFYDITERMCLLYPEDTEPMIGSWQDFFDSIRIPEGRA